jgi:ATP phosphoribosyltransferase
MNGTDRVRIAMQKKGRLAERSMELLRKCGIDVDWRADQLICSSVNLPLDVMLVRDDDIPGYVQRGICELGIVGQNVVEEVLAGTGQPGSVRVLDKLGFGRCRLSIAVPKSLPYGSPASLAGKRIATAYPNLLRGFLRGAGVDAEIVEMHGSVEIAPALELADAICDLVQTGSTLLSNGLVEVERIFESEAVVIQTARPLSPVKQQLIRRLEQRVTGVTRAVGAKYVMMNAPRSALDEIYRILPGMEAPSIIPIGTDGARVAIHAVARETDFWGMMERLKEVGASSILVAPIEKIID